MTTNGIRYIRTRNWRQLKVNSINENERDMGNNNNCVHLNMRDAFSFDFIYLSIPFRMYVCRVCRFVYFTFKLFLSSLISFGRKHTHTRTHSIHTLCDNQMNAAQKMSNDDKILSISNLYMNITFLLYICSWID